MNNPKLIEKASDKLKEIASDLEYFIEDLPNGDKKDLFRKKIHEAREISDNLSETLMNPLQKEIYSKL